MPLTYKAIALTSIPALTIQLFLGPFLAQEVHWGGLIDFKLLLREAVHDLLIQTFVLTGEEAALKGRLVSSVPIQFCRYPCPRRRYNVSVPTAPGPMCLRLSFHLSWVIRPQHQLA